MIPYKGYRIYGPYERKTDNRRHVVVISPEGKQKTVSYSRYLIEINIGRYLTNEEEVHHIDGDESNDLIFNLVAIPKKIHRGLLKGSKYPKLISMLCVECGKEILLDSKQQSARKSLERKGKAGPFCSKSCAGKYGKKIQEMK